MLASSSLPVWGWVLLVVGLLILVGKVRDRRDRHSRLDDSSGGGFASVAGCDEAIEDLREIVAFLTHPERFERVGATVPKGALLVGPPGTGKTLLARAVAAEAGVPFLAANGSDFVEMYVGVGAKRIRELFAEARSHRGAIVFIDELDAVARRRGGGGAGDTAAPSAFEHENTLIALLTELDGFTPSDRVITLAATNRPDVLDPAVVRPGRLERRVEVPLPDRVARQAILEVHCRNKPLGADVRLDDVAARTPQMSGAELARVCNEAALAAVRQGKVQLDADCFDRAVELVATGRARTSATVTERDREITAWHEAGHATAALVLHEVADPLAVSVVPRGSFGGVTWMGDPEHRFVSKEQATAQIVTLLAGRVAEERLLGGSCTQGAANDLERATEIATEMAARLGMTTRGLAVTRPDDRSTRLVVDELLAESYDRTVALLDQHQRLLVAIATALCETDRLGAGELAELRSRYASGRFEPVPSASDRQR